ncbi:MAG: sulfatase-like hydrolase/transferase [Gammaproteobacteria bacterium]|nr:sulfatase-like hydrolase/transferase [Gammaproteobacteria bacterium]
MKLSPFRFAIVVVITSLLWGCDSQDQNLGLNADEESSSEVSNQNAAPNILVIIADDLGVEQLAAFGIGTQPASTPNLDRLAQQGMSFSNVWAQPICSPTRATLLTGRYGFRTGIGSATPERVAGEYPEINRSDSDEPELSFFEGATDKPVEIYEDLGPVFQTFRSFYINDGLLNGPPFPSAYGLKLNELGLPALLKNSNSEYSTAALGKWHLGDNRNGWLQHPSNVGFDYFSINMLNQPESYFTWFENVNGLIEKRTGYTPEQKVDDAISWVGSQGNDKPWLLWLAFNLPHYPHHVPEVEGLNSSEIEASDPRAALDVMTARLDQEIGRLLAGIDEETLENTIVVLIGDNGTTGEANDPPFHPERGKFTLYEGGVRVPLIITGPGIPQGEQSSVMVNSTDLFATLIELSGNEVPESLEHDSVSLAPYFANPAASSVRDFIYADTFYEGSGFEEGVFAIRNDRYKLIRWNDHQELYDLAEDPYENSNLLLDGESEAEIAIIEGLENRVLQLRSI